MSDRFEDEEYLSWLKLSLALIYTKEALECFTDREVLAFHGNLKASILGAHGSSPTAPPTCSRPTCTHTQLKKQWFQGTFKCPCNVCDTWIQEILQHHACLGSHVKWENSDISRLPVVPWECMKLYLPSGYQRQSTVQEFDLAALLSVYLNCRHFRNFFTIPGNHHDHICKKKVPVPFLSITDQKEKMYRQQKSLLMSRKRVKVKEVRNGVMHSGQMKVDTAQLLRDVATIKTLLQDPKHLINDPDCQEGVRKIETLMAERLELWLNKKLELRALNSRMQALEDNVEQMQNEYEDISNKLYTVSEDVEELKQDRADLEKVKEDYGALKKSVVDFTSFIEEHKIQKVDTDRLLQCETKLTSLMQEVETKVQHQGDKLQELEKTVEDHKRRLEDLEKTDKPAKTSSIECSPDDVQKLQQFLMKHYRERFMLAQNPIMPEEEVPLDDIYVEPDIRVLRERCGQSALKDVHQGQASELSCKQIFQTGSYNCQQICITGDAETGKSMFCKSIVNKWLKSHSNDTISDNEKSARARLFQYVRDWNKQKLDKRRENSKYVGKQELEEWWGKIKCDADDIDEIVWDELFQYIRGCNIQKKEDRHGENLRVDEDRDIEESYVAQLFRYIRDLYKQKLDERRCEKINGNEDRDIRDQVLAELGRYIRGWNEQKIKEQPGKNITDEEDSYIEAGVRLWRRWSIHLHKKNYEERHGESKSDGGDSSQDKSCAKELSEYSCMGYDYAGRLFEYISGSSNIQELEELLKHKEEDRGILKEFTLLFCISLRDCTSECKITEMIESQYLLHCADTQHVAADSFLKKEKCLVILDGLDKWNCPGNRSLSIRSNPGIPGWDLLNKNVVILTTARPCQFNFLRLKTELDKHIELCGLGESSAKQVSYKVIKMLNSSHNIRTCVDEFWSTLEQNSLCHCKSNPVILIQLICLWFKKKGLSESEVAIYRSRIDMFLE